MRNTPEVILVASLALFLSGPGLHGQQDAAPSQAPAQTGVTPTGNSQAASPVSSDSQVSGDSKVRIVRLSQVEGQVQLDRNIGRGFEQALSNLPIVEGAKLQTTSGVAEVELEDSSTLRLAPDTTVEFPNLRLHPDGVKASTVSIVKGTVYVSLLNNKENELTLKFGDESLAVPPASHIRLQVDASKAKLAVMEGAVPVTEPFGQTEVGKKKTVTFDLAGKDEPTIDKKVAEYDYDAWDKEAFDYHKRYANASAFANSPYAFGISDLNYYGSFVDVGGCGSMWRPYFVSASWDPYANGVWALYSGAGYSWVSPYPWGWMPYHYGAWSYCSGLGWGWQPGGAWMGLGNTSIALNRRLHGPQGGPGPRPVMPPRPITGHPGLIAVNEKPLPVSKLSGQDTFLFSKDSAGFGVPRGSLGKLDGFSRGVERHGAVATPVYSLPVGNSQTARGTTPIGTTSLRQGTSLGPSSSNNIRTVSQSPGLSNPSSSGGMNSGGMGSRGMNGGGMGAGGVSHGSSGGSGGSSGGSHR